MIWIPFNKCDAELEKFCRDFAPAEFKGQAIVKAAKFTGKVGVDEDILLVAHGTGVAISNFDWDGTTDKPKGYKAVQPDGLAPELHAILPKNYRGTITLWCCEAARPWKHIKDVREQIERMSEADQDVDKDAALEQSYLKLLFGQLRSDLDRPQQLRGPIGSITLDRPAAAAKIYASDKDLMFGETRSLIGGMVHAGETPDEVFYAEYDSSEDDDFLMDASNDDASSAADRSVASTQNTGSGSAQDTGIPDTSMQDTSMLEISHASSYRTRNEYLDTLVANMPFGGSSRPPTLKERLASLNKKHV